MNNKNFKLFQLNAHGISRKKYVIQSLANKFDIFIIIETWLKPNMKFNLKNFAIIRKDILSNKGGGICICIKKHIIFQGCDPFVDIPDVLENLNILLFPNTINFSYQLFTDRLTITLTVIYGILFLNI